MSKDRVLEELLGEMRKANAIYEGSSGDGGRKAAAMDGQAEIAKGLAANDTDKLGKAVKKANKAKLEARIEALTRLMAENREPSKARSIGSGKATFGPGGRFKGDPSGAKPVKAFRQSFRDYKAGEIVTAIAAVKGYLDDSLETRALGGQKIAEFATFMGAPEMSKAYMLLGSDGKATLGTTGATGGYVLPNNLVDSVIKPNVQQAIYPTLGMRVINGVAVRGVDQPYRTGAPARATFANWGALKENVDEAYGSYTATLGTLAKIYDVGKQYLRFSAGSAEQDVIDEITKSMMLAENYAVIAGPGTGASTPGVNDPTYGVYTALAAGALTYTTAHSAVATTLLGSFAEGLTVGNRALAARSRTPSAWVVDGTTFWTAIGQGTDTAGFWSNPAGGPTQFSMTSSGQLRFWGQPVYFDANLGTNATTKIAIGGEWDALKLYRGIEFRIDSSDVAGTRWDYNLVGFRGEEEIGIHAGTAVSVGAFQLVTGIIP
ncbi:MAG TPA: phage major capsid protein [Candidatus Limnocylindrales bacterium]